MSVLDELGFKPLDLDAQGIVDLDLLDLSVDIEVTTLNSQLGLGMDDIQPVENSPVMEVKLEEPAQDCGIEATDVGSLLEQFEEKASQNFGTSKSKQQQTSRETNNNGDTKDKNSPIHADSTFLTKDFLERIQRLRAEKKKKTAVMLPMVVPAKRGRGRAMTRGHPVALPAGCTPRRLQRVMMQNQDLREYMPMCEEDAAVMSKRKDDDGGSCPGAPSDKSGDLDIMCDHDYFKKESDTPQIDSGQIGPDLEEGEVIEDEENLCEDMMTKVAQYKNKRRAESPQFLNEDHQYFDKLPSYYTALSIPRKQIRKTAANVTRRGGLSVHDFIERDHSPVREATDSTYSKIPNYYCSFTNSTRYDSMSLDTCKANDDSNSVKDSSGYSSLCQSVQDSDSNPTRSRSGSRSPSVSPSKSRRSSSRHFHRRSRKGNYRRQSSCSPSSVASSSRSCSRSSCSGCQSRSRSASRARSRSNSCSSSYSRSSSVSSSSRSRSRGRSWQRERRARSERNNRSGGRARRNRSRSSLYSGSRSPSRDYRSRSRSCTPPEAEVRQQSRERRRAAKKQEREEEKQKQMRERRIVYVGGIPNNYTRHQMRGAFSRFGEIELVQLHFREHGDNYGFVTFTYTCDAYAAIEKGKTLPELEGFDLCFGGRRQFCDVEYADLDGNKEVEEEFDPKPRKQEVLDFDELLRQARASIKK